MPCRAKNTAGDRRRMTAAERYAQILSGRCAGAATPSLARIYSPVALSPAQRDAALLAAAGQSNKDIAKQLHLSVRTVEGRLQRAYARQIEVICASTLTRPRASYSGYVGPARLVFVDHRGALPFRRHRAGPATSKTVATYSRSHFPWPAVARNAPLCGCRALGRHGLMRGVVHPTCLRTVKPCGDAGLCQRAGSQDRVHGRTPV
jgi:DNA-binding CsgD family transcriptional regulator